MLSSRQLDQRARDLADANLHKLESHVLSAVRRHLASERIDLPQPDLEDAYNQGWHGVCQMVSRGEEIENLNGLLITITRRRAIDAYRQRKEGAFTDGPLKEHYADGIDVVERVDDQHKLDRLVRRMVERLNDKERRAVTLCLLHGYTRPEAAKLLGVPEPAFQKVMDRATRKIADFVAGIDARGCGDDEWARVLRAYALGLIGEDHPDYPRVGEHLEDCEPCRRYVMTLRGLAAVLPPMAPFGHGIAVGVTHVYRLLGSGHGAVTAGTSTGGGVLAGTGASSGSGGGVIGVLGGGAAKAFAVAATGVVLTAGAVTVHVVGQQRPGGETRQIAQRQSFVIASGAGLFDELGQAPRAWPFVRLHRTSRPIRRQANRDRRHLVGRPVVAQERPVSGGLPASSAVTPQSSSSTGGQGSSSRTPSEPEGQGNEFGFESGG